MVFKGVGFGPGILGNTKIFVDKINKRKEKERLDNELEKKLRNTSKKLILVSKEVFNHVENYLIGKNYGYNIKKGENFRHEVTLPDGKILFYIV